MKIKKILKILIITCLVVVIIDQTSKFVINNYFRNEISSRFNKKTIGDIGIFLVVIIVALNYIFSQKEKISKSIVIYLSLIVSGGISNVIDIIFKGAIFDFIKIGQAPIFNLADMIIALGWVLFAVNFAKDSAIDFKANRINWQNSRKTKANSRHFDGCY